ncbi:MAG: hypothetical protein M3Y05_17040 [Gemmatimonadota bacterium]|nr:hypothetical protein [Gemmatimonadota bacterium]
MFLELVDSLRCVCAHEDSWLVARADAMIERHVVEGELGCPVCLARYPIHEGVADFTLGETTPRHARGVAPDQISALALRAAALLGLGEAGGIVVLAGEWSAAAKELIAMTENVMVLALDYSHTLRSGGALSLARIAHTLPLAAGSVRGIAVDAAHATPSLLAGAERALAPGGRLIAPAYARIPDTLQELARDDEQWVAAASAGSKPSTPVSIAVKRHAPA